MMSLPQMDCDPTARALRVPVCPLTLASTIAEAAARLRVTGELTAVVTRRGEPVGLVGAEAIRDAIRTGRSEASLASVMDRIVVRVDPNDDAWGTLQRFTNAAWDWMLSRRSAGAGRCDPSSDCSREPTSPQETEQ
jgi:hypothetical protein